MENRNGGRPVARYTRPGGHSPVKMVELALLTAIILVLQLVGIGLKLPFLGTPISLVLIPISLGAMLLGPIAGGFLGFVFGFEVFIVCGVMGTDPFTAMLFADHPVLTFLICSVKSTAAGFVAGVLYRLCKEKRPLLGSFLAAGITPILNTGLFILGCIPMFDTVSGIAAGTDHGFLYFVVIICAGINFIFEFLINMAVAPALCRVEAAIIKTRHKA